MNGPAHVDTNSPSSAARSHGVKVEEGSRGNELFKVKEDEIMLEEDEMPEDGELVTPFISKASSTLARLPLDPALTPSRPLRSSCTCSSTQSTPSTSAGLVCQAHTQHTRPRTDPLAERGRRRVPVPALVPGAARHLHALLPALQHPVLRPAAQHLRLCALLDSLPAGLPRARARAASAGEHDEAGGGVAFGFLRVLSSAVLEGRRTGPQV